MKHLCIFLFVFNFGLNAAVHSQNQRVSIELKNASIEDLIVAIKSQCDMGFLYDCDKTKSVKNITVNMQNVLLSEVLSKALLGTGFVAEIENNMIIIKEAPLNQQKEARTVKGRVTDNKKAPLPGVTVLIKGTSIGVVTDTAGMYKVTLPDQKDITLLFSFIGMVSQTISYKNIYDLSNNVKKCVRFGQEIPKGTKFYELYHDFAAYQYGTLLLSNTLVDGDKDRIKVVMKEMKDYSWLLTYHVNPKIKLQYYVKKIVGYNNLIRFLKLYTKIKRY